MILQLLQTITLLLKYAHFSNIQNTLTIDQQRQTLYTVNILGTR